MIHEARKRRQMARELGDFVPLDDTVKVEKSASRLVRFVNGLPFTSIGHIFLYVDSSGHVGWVCVFLGGKDEKSTRG